MTFPKHRHRLLSHSPRSVRIAARRIEETVTVQRLGITGKLKRTLDSTNPAESMPLRKRMPRSPCEVKQQLKEFT